MAKTKNPLSGLSLDSITQSTVDKQLGKSPVPAAQSPVKAVKKSSGTVAANAGNEGKNLSSSKTNVSIQIHVDLRKRLKRMCLEEEIGMQAFVEKLLDEALSKKGF